MKEDRFTIDGIPAVLFGEQSGRVWLFVHGKLGNKEEAAAFAGLADGAQVLAVDLPGHGERSGEGIEALTPWNAVPELERVYAYAAEHWQHISLRATSIGCWFAMLSLDGKPLEKALFVSPVTDMAKLIRDMMGWAGVTEAELEQKGQIPTPFGETLDWQYYRYAEEHPVLWDVPTAVLYAGQDNLTSRETIESFTAPEGRTLTVLEEGEHWFHTPEQLAFMAKWEQENL